MDSPILTCPEFLAMEQALIDDFIVCTRESCVETEFCVKALNHNGGSDYVHRLFRALHSLKGNCQMVGLKPFSEPLHKIEDIVSRVRTNEVPYRPVIGEFFILVTDIIEDLLLELIKTQQTDNLRCIEVFRVSETLLNNLNELNVQEVFQTALDSLEKRDRETVATISTKNVPFEVPDDLELMGNLSIHIDNLSIHRQNRSGQVVELAEQLNAALGWCADARQLHAAALMHDVGMSFIPHHLSERAGRVSREEFLKIQEHVVISSQLLLRFGGWDDAARMVFEHHERFDGLGYPNAISGQKIHPGGRILSIVDTFCSIITEQSDRTVKKTLLSAISEINANSETQFDPGMVQVFNNVVRRMMVKSAQ